MSQHSFSIANEAGASFRADVNNALQALASQSSGATAPTTTYAYQRWADTTTNTMKQRNAANSAWLMKETLDETFVLSRSTNTILGLADHRKTILASGSFTQTLTASATLGDGWECNYANVGTGTITFSPNGVETINGVTLLAFGPGESGTIKCNGSSLQIVNRSRYAGAIASGRNIAARTNAVTPNTQVDISADELQLKDASGNVKVVTSFAVTINFATTGANGLDTGVQAINTWYYGWVIAKEDGTVAGLGSLSSSAPTLPAGYTYKALVTAARSNASTQFNKYRQFGNWCYYEAAQVLLNAGPATTETAQSTATLVPPLALAAQLQFQYINPNPSTAFLRLVSGANFFSLDSNSSVAITKESVVVPNIGQNVYYVNGAVGGGSDLFVQAFKLPGGGE